MNALGSLACRLGLHSHYPHQIGKWYANDRCTRCGTNLNRRRPAPVVTPSGEGSE